MNDDPSSRGQLDDEEARSLVQALLGIQREICLVKNNCVMPAVTSVLDVKMKTSATDLCLLRTPGLPIEGVSLLDAHRQIGDSFSVELKNLETKTRAITRADWNGAHSIGALTCKLRARDFSAASQTTSVHSCVHS